MKPAGGGLYRKWLFSAAGVLAVLAVVLFVGTIKAPLKVGSKPPPAPSAPAPSAPTNSGAAAPEQSASQPGAAGETAGSSYGADKSGAVAGGGSGVAYDMSPEGAAPPTAGEAETAAAPHPHRAAKSAPSPKLTEDQMRRAIEAVRAMEQNDQAMAARRRDERAGAMTGGGSSTAPRVGSAEGRVAGAARRDGAAPPPVVPPPPTAQFAPPVIVGAAEPLPAAIALPEFPWPPPPPSDRMLLPRAGFARGLGANPSLMDAAGHLTDALGQAGYSQYSFYSAPGGFALVARLERIRPDGTPEPEGQRFAPPSATEPFSLGIYLKQLFIAPEGYYRLIVFVVTDNVVVTKGAAPTAAIAEAWLRKGADRLPAAYATLPFTKEHEVDALIYEFRKEGKGQATTLTPSPIDARAHLEKAGLYALLVGGAGH